MNFVITPDHINACFEAVGAIFTFMNTLRVYRDKGYAGVYVPAIVFFFAWGGWNLYFYPSVGAMWSFGAGIALFISNLMWVSLLAYYGPVQNPYEQLVSKYTDTKGTGDAPTLTRT